MPNENTRFPVELGGGSYEPGNMPVDSPSWLSIICRVTLAGGAGFILGRYTPRSLRKFAKTKRNQGDQKGIVSEAYASVLTNGNKR